MTKKLVNKAGEAVQIGDTVRDCRGESYTVQGATEPQHAASSGRIHTEKGSFFPHVFDCKFIDVEKKAPLCDTCTQAATCCYPVNKSKHLPTEHCDYYKITEAEPRRVYFVMETQRAADGAYKVLIAIEGVRGYSRTSWTWKCTLDQAEELAASKNADMDITPAQAQRIICGTMRP